MPEWEDGRAEEVGGGRGAMIISLPPPSGSRVGGSPPLQPPSQLRSAWRRSPRPATHSPRRSRESRGGQASSPGRGLRAPSSPLPRSVPSPGARCENQQQQPRTPGVLQPTGAGYGGPPPGQGWGPPNDQGREANVSGGGRVRGGWNPALFCSLRRLCPPTPLKPPMRPSWGRRSCLRRGSPGNRERCRKGSPLPPLSVPLGPGVPYTHVWVVPAPAREGGV